MKREVRIFLTAVMFYTRIPCPAWVGHEPEFINLATRYFPLIGWIVGTMYSLFIISACYFFSPIISILIGLVGSVLLTGAFHEDGFADVCDGFGGGWTKEKILLIMKDSRVGTYGVVGLLLLMGLKVAATEALLNSMSVINFFVIIVASHSLSRTMSVVIIFTQPYAREENDSKAKPVASGISLWNATIAFIFGLLPLAVLILKTGWMPMLLVPPLALMTFYLSHYFKKWIGGYTGDCLGATQQLNEVIFLLSALVVWKFI